MGSKRKKILAACGSYTGVSVKTSLVSEYRTVFDEMITKPTGLDRYAQNYLVRNLVNKNLWNYIDYLNWFAAHTNANGEACLNYKLPKGGNNLTAPGKGNFNTNIESWLAVGANIVAWDNGSLKTTYVNNSQGSMTYLRLIDDLSTNLTVGKYYKISGYAKTNIGSYNINIWSNPVNYYSGSITSTSWEYFEVIFLCNHSTFSEFRFVNFSVGEILWLKNYKITEYNNAILYNTPTFTAREGITGGGVNEYIDHRFVLAVSGVNYVQDDAGISEYIRNDVNENKRNFGVCDGALGNYAYGGTTGAYNSHIGINTSGSETGVNGGSDGLFIYNREGANFQKLYKNSAAIINGVAPSTGIPASWSLCSFALNNQGVLQDFCTKQKSFFAIHKSFNAQQRADLSEVVNGAMTILGKNVY